MVYKLYIVLTNILIYFINPKIVYCKNLLIFVKCRKISKTSYALLNKEG